MKILGVLGPILHRLCSISIWFIGRVLITYHRSHTCLGLGLVLYAFE